MDCDKALNRLLNKAFEESWSWRRTYCALSELPWSMGIALAHCHSGELDKWDEDNTAAVVREVIRQIRECSGSATTQETRPLWDRRKVVPCIVIGCKDDADVGLGDMVLVPQNTAIECGGLWRSGLATSLGEQIMFTNGDDTKRVCVNSLDKVLIVDERAIITPLARAEQLCAI